MLWNHTKYTRLYKIVQMNDRHDQDKINFTDLFFKEDISARQWFRLCMFERTLGLWKMHTVEIAYVNDNDIKSNIYN